MRSEKWWLPLIPPIRSAQTGEGERSFFGGPMLPKALIKEREKR